MKSNTLLKIVLASLSVTTAYRASAGFNLGDAADYAVLNEGGSGNSFQFNNGAIGGNVGIGGTEKAQLNGPGTINGNVDFSAANTGQYSDSGVAVNLVNYNDSDVTTAISTVNNLYSTLSGESGAVLAITVGNGGNQTINASSGMLDASGNEVFTVSSVSFVNGATLTINGSSSQFVVLNISGGAHFGGTILLTGGIKSNQVLFDVNGTLQISANGATETGTFLDPNGNIQVNHSVLDGNLYGAENQNMSIVSGAYVYAPTPAAVPEPTTILTGALLLLPLGASTMLRLRKKLTAAA